MLLANFRGADKRVKGCPVKAPTPAPGPSPLPDNALVLLRSERGHDSELCGYEFCLSNHVAEWNYTRVGTEGYMPAASQAAGVARADLKLYWSSGSHDNYVTTALDKVPDGFADTGSPVGTVLAEQAHGTVPLFVYFNAARGDHLTCASQRSIAYAKANGYSLVQPQPIGYVFAAPEWSESMQ